MENRFVPATMTTQTLRSVLTPATAAIHRATVVWIFCSTCLAAAQSEEPGVLTIGTPDGSGGSYTLSDGVLNTSGTHVGPHGRFEQFGGTHAVSGDLKVEGGIVLSGGGTAYAQYTMTDGTIAAETTRICVGVFTQSGGTNLSGELNIGPHNAQCTFNLSGGRLETLNTTLKGSWQGGMNQTAGSHIVGGRLSVIGDSFYQPVYLLNGGELHASEVELTLGILRHQSGSLVNAGPLILNGGTFETAVNAQFGALQVLGSAGDTATIRMRGASSVVRFASSSSAPWDASVALVIEGWNGSIQGGGAEQIVFGENSSALTTDQLAKIRFKDPAGCPPGVYPARILPSGELAPGPYLDTIVSNGRMTLKWDVGYVLQSSISPVGPFEDVSGAASPYVPNGAEGQRFFRLRK